ncbi:hypothetical protein [Rhizobium lentis]|uniref:RES domain-containing protein n=1 Tax=Rhizobium lentis TaxID=1138194 RepID=A0A7W8XDV9_9HYPH|nr:hypothetical protein [Rhizobium lentis]MBB5551010.1 hypothetical protein [Rhizobium lentis]MBB5561545.1 hypothetical protein [Rhizobium lentis]MBB5568129.1 hypothetical protein [Rhizobium lentis]
MEQQPPIREPSCIFCKISRRFFRSVLAERLDQVLDPPDEKSAGRYHRFGQPVLYMSSSAEWGDHCDFRVYAGGWDDRVSSRRCR